MLKKRLLVFISSNVVFLDIDDPRAVVNAFAAFFSEVHSSSTLFVRIRLPVLIACVL